MKLNFSTFWRRHYNHKKVLSIMFETDDHNDFLESTVVDVAKKMQATKSTGQNLNVEVNFAYTHYSVVTCIIIF